MNPIEIGLISGEVSNIYYSDETNEMMLRVYNGMNSQGSATVKFEIYNYLNEKVKEGSIPLVIEGNSVYETHLDVSTGETGSFRIVLWLDGVLGSREELVYSIIPRPKIMSIDEDSMIGVHPVFHAYHLESLQKLGIKWARVMSPSAFFRWSRVEPVDDEIIWYDEEVQRAKDYGISILGTIGTNDYWPSWADDNGLPDLDEWEEFVGQIVEHYKNDVKYWEVWNEPIHNFESEFYAHMSERMANAVYSMDPDAKVVGMGGSWRIEWIKEVIENLGPTWTEKMDVVATHMYPPNSDPRGSGGALGAAEFNTDIVQPYNMPVWNTETGDWCQGFYMTENSNFLSPGVNLWPHKDAERYMKASLVAPKRVMINFLHNIGNNITKYFVFV